MLVVDTSGSMGTSISGGTNSCNYQNNRIGHARCAVRNTVQAFAGQVNFGLSSYAWRETACQNVTCGTCSQTTGCFTQCTPQYAPADDSFCGPLVNEPTLGALVHGGANVVVPLLQDHYWSTPPDAPNAQTIVNFVDNNCGNNEIGADSNTPLGGVLFNMHQYFSGAFRDPFTNALVASPIGTVAQGERPCRSINVILITDGDETCDAYNTGTYPNFEGLAVYEANRLFGAGVTFGGQNFKIKVHVIGFVGATTSALNNIANAGGTGTARSTANEAQLAQALSQIISGSVAPESCDNADNNCNGCTDEGFTHYCNTNPTCCSWGTPAQRTACLTNYQNSITPGNPTGNVALLPCTTATQQTDPVNWLCYNPLEVCDNNDNNCSAGVDEGTTRCGSPLHCPTTEVCNSQDDNCNGQVDENVCSGCVPSAEICDGCDNDCDGLIDEGITSVACGQPSPANCAGTLACPQKNMTPGPVGACVMGNPYAACTNMPQTEVCDGVDNNCNGQVDEGIAPTTCVPPGTPGGQVYGAPSQCRQGTMACGSTACIGYIGPSTEVCDGIDNDCDGQIDESASGIGQACGIATGECSTGLTACVNGSLVCQGGVGPTNEVCDTLDNDCDGQTDETPLADGPPAGSNGCWNNPGNCCTFGGISWCPPQGGTCNGPGTLTAPCATGTLACVNGGWTCQNSRAPSTEVCDTVDNNCNGQIDEGLSGASCGTNTGECTAGTVQCTNGVTSCVGSVGPTTETCNNLDDDCDGQTDEGISGLGTPCGNNTMPCRAGATACVNGQIICQGAILPQSEVCDGVDNDCDGTIDDGPFTNGPPPGQTGCWTLPGNCCTFGNLNWCPPPGGTCSGSGTLTSPCHTGTLTCMGAAGWSCVGPANPGPEVCDMADNNCDGTVDNVTPMACVPAGTPGGLDYGGNSQCRQGTMTCGACNGFIGPSAEVCDGIDNDCDGVVDEGAFGTNQPCGVNQPPCSAGVTACVNAVLVCQGGVGPQPERCDGVDNNCDGTVDNAPLSDGPPAGQNGCWNDPGNCCSFGGLTWCPPPGATCNDNGMLTSPCNRGSLVCAGAGGWVCQAPKGPASETCDGLDNDCNGTVDDGSLPGVGGECGTDVGDCIKGTVVCTNGNLDCANDVPPSPETCDGRDNDCDGTTDNGIPLGGSCAPTYDTMTYPGDRTGSPCQPGVLQCNGAGGLECVGGVGPRPEVCDGIDNDCDGNVDEVGPAPDGLDGTANPLPPPNGSIGQSCGVNEGTCAAGQYACENGVFVCRGGQGPTAEECDCQDNDCNGVVDNGASDSCTAGKTCVAGANGCQCAAPCGSGEFQCPPGQQCEQVTESGTGTPLGSYCTTDYTALCGDCSTKTVKDTNGNVQCAPAGTQLPGCITPPVCVCKGPAGCQDPCTGVVCDAGTVCAATGPAPGTCVVDNCYNVPCMGCGKVCNAGSCVDNPCTATTCPPDQVCVPNGDFTGTNCVATCAGVPCSTGQTCVNGTCVDTCDPPCAMGQVCDMTAPKPTCVTDMCNPNPCTNGACCQTINGGTSFTCGNCPCEGVICPTGQVCQAGSCIDGGGGSGGAGGAGSSSSSSSSSSSASSSSGAGGEAGTGGVGGEGGTWGLPTGGGGCSCDVGSTSQGEW
ncbi:MAG TPA: MopE-related protein, partial [Polyangium sp.]|nr:MopE-related protein [Polyangium sp.]